jgi:hypothetical protein
MATARRFYVYALSAISLAVLLVGVTMLLDALLSVLGIGSGDVLYGSNQPNREQLTLGAALVAVGLPVWLIHWTIAERGVRGDGAEAEVERSSSLRGLYMAAMLAVLLAVAATRAVELLQDVIYTLGGQASLFGNASSALAGFVVAGVAWLYHLAVRFADWRRGPIHGAGAWLPRLYLYGAAGVGLLGLLASLSGLVDLALRAIFTPGQSLDAVDGTAWWVYPLAADLAPAVVAGVTWLGHWWYAGRLVTESSDRVAAERPARLRLAYFAGITVVLAGVVLVELIEVSQRLLQGALGVQVSDVEPLAVSTLGPVTAAALFAVAWWLHRGWWAADVSAVSRADPERAATAARLDAYGHALLGLAFVGVAAAWLIGLAIQAILGSADLLGGSDFLRTQLSAAAPTLVLGGAVWLWAWSTVLGRWHANPGVEAGSAVRRAALLAVLGASVVGAIGGFGFLFYRLFGALFGVALSSDVATDVSMPVGVVLVAVVAGTAHAMAIRRDQAIRAASAAAESAAPALAAPAEGAPDEADGGVAVVLRLTGPSEAPIRVALAALRRDLPAGYDLEVGEARPQAD